MAEVSIEDVGAQVLIDAARAAARHAHAPYSRFAVGAALLMTDGSIVTGTNFENASYGLSLCAETVALATANAQGRLADVLAVAVIGGAMGPDGVPVGDKPVGPCGRCRQVHERGGADGRARPARLLRVGRWTDGGAAHALGAAAPCLRAGGPRDRLTRAPRCPSGRRGRV